MLASMKQCVPGGMSRSIPSLGEQVVLRGFGDLVRDGRVYFDALPPLLGDEAERLDRDPHALVLFQRVERFERPENPRFIDGFNGDVHTQFPRALLRSIRRKIRGGFSMPDILHPGAPGILAFILWPFLGSGLVTFGIPYGTALR